MSFHVPESARGTTHSILGSSMADGNNGVFRIESPEPGWHLVLIASDGGEWEHVSVHAHRIRPGEVVTSLRPVRVPQLRTPTWKEMAYVKALYWDDEDTVVQFHPRKSEYVNNHPHVLHLWRPTDSEIPCPPVEFV